MGDFLEDLSHEELRKYNKKELSERLNELEVDHNLKQTKVELIDLLRSEGGQFDEYVEEDNYIEPETYLVLYDFKDLEDNGYVYVKDNKYPRRSNKKVTQDRINQLITKNNKIGKKLIIEQE